jgi:hypothetical protein
LGSFNARRGIEVGLGGLIGANGLPLASLSLRV